MVLSTVANIALVKSDKARKIEDLLIMNAQRGALPIAVSAVGGFKRLQVSFRAKWTRRSSRPCWSK